MFPAIRPPPPQTKTIVPENFALDTESQSPLCDRVNARFDIVPQINAAQPEIGNGKQPDWRAEWSHQSIGQGNGKILRTEPRCQALVLGEDRFSVR
jgi:hypothetical protein